MIQTDKDLWIFAYGSLMWRPGFEFTERIAARLPGAHRALCVISIHHRGTPEKPGLVLGLDHGGSCSGIAFRVAAPLRSATLNYLREREQVTGVYKEVMRPILLQDKREVPALCYIVDRAHSQYAGKLPLETIKRHVLQGQGLSGANTDYVTSTVAELDRLNITDTMLHRLVAELSNS